MSGELTNDEQTVGELFEEWIDHRLTVGDVRRAVRLLDAAGYGGALATATARIAKLARERYNARWQAGESMKEAVHHVEVVKRLRAELAAVEYARDDYCRQAGQQLDAIAGLRAERDRMISAHGLTMEERDAAVEARDKAVASVDLWIECCREAEDGRDEAVGLLRQASEHLDSRDNQMLLRAIYAMLAKVTPP